MVGRQPLPAAASHGCVHALSAEVGEDRLVIPAKGFFGRVFLRRLFRYAWLCNCALLLAELARGREWYTALNTYHSLWLPYIGTLKTWQVWMQPSFPASHYPKVFAIFILTFFQSRALFPALRHAFHFGDVRWSVINWQYVQEQRGDEVHFNETNPTG